MRTLGLALVLVAASGTAARAEPPGLSLDQLIARSLASSRARMAHHDTEAASARVDEARAAWLPRLSATAFLAPSPEVECEDPDCMATTGLSLLRLSGAFGGVSVQLTQPLYTFGKLGGAHDAARAGVVARRALEDATAGDLALEAARAYWGLKLARELIAMIDDGIAELEEARDRLLERLAEGSGDATIQDRQRLETLLAEARIQRTDARAAEATALAGVRAIVATAGGATDSDAADAALDVDDDPLEARAVELDDAARYVERAAARRPELRAARAEARAAAGRTEAERAGYWPDLALVGSLDVRRAQGVDDAPSEVYADPYNNTIATVSVTLRWTIEPWTTRARVARARATERRAEAEVAIADLGATLEAQHAWAEASEARQRMAAAGDGETAARGWLASVLQSDALGLAETRDLADAYLAWFQTRARLATAIFQWNVATVRLDRATGAFTARVGGR